MAVGLRRAWGLVIRAAELDDSLVRCLLPEKDGPVPRATTKIRGDDPSRPGVSPDRISGGKKRPPRGVTGGLGEGCRDEMGGDEMGGEVPADRLATRWLRRGWGRVSGGAAWPVGGRELFRATMLHRLPNPGARLRAAPRGRRPGGASAMICRGNPRRSGSTRGRSPLPPPTCSSRGGGTRHETHGAPRD